MTSGTCADPEGFARGDPTLTIFYEGGKEERIQIALKVAIIGLPSKRHFNGVSLVGDCWPNICWLGSFVIFKGILTSIAKKPYIL